MFGPRLRVTAIAAAGICPVSGRAARARPAVPGTAAVAPPCIAALALLLIAGCAVGPNFKKPAAPDVSDYTAAPLSSTVAKPERRRRGSPTLCQGS
jgi:hypothetical protein